MSGGVHENVWRNAKNARGAVLLTLLALADESNDSGDVDTTVAVIAAKARTTDRHIRRIIAQLDAMHGVSAMCHEGRIVARLTAFAVVNVESPAPAPTDRMSATDEMSGHPVRHGRNVRAAVTSAAPPHARCLIPPPTKTKTQSSAANAASDVAPVPAAPTRRRVARAEAGPPTPHQALFGAVCDACGLDPAFLDGHTTANVGKAAAFFAAQGVDPATIVAAWAAEHDRLAAAFPERTISPPTVARLKVIVGSYRKATAPPKPSAPADSRPPIGAVLSRLGLSESQPERWPPDVLARYRDIAEMWGYAPAGGAA